MIWLPLTFFAILVVTSGYLAARTEGYYGTILVFSIAYFVYNMAIPLEMVLTGDGWARDDHGETFLEPGRLQQIISSALWGYFGFCIGYLASFRVLGRKKRAPLFYTVLAGDYRIPNSLIVFTGLSVALSLWLAWPFLGTIGDYDAWTELRYNSGLLSFTLELAYTSAAMLGLALIHRFKLGVFTSLLVVSPNILWGLYSNDKDPMLLGALAYAPVVWRYWPSRSLAGFLLMWAGAALLGVMAVIAFSQNRGGQEIRLSEHISERGLFRRTDPAGPLLSLNDTLDDLEKGEMSYSYGLTYLQGLVLWVPRSLWRDRPRDLSQKYAQQKIEHWSEGKGVGFSLLSESFINFGWIGPLVQYLFLGMFWRVIWFSLIQRLFSNTVLFYSVYIPVGFYILIKMHRGPFSTIVTGIMHIVVPLLVIHILLSLVQRKPRNKGNEVRDASRLGS